jgi:phosphoribosyl-ATP pyrophosphohydrolase/phosphoribosyl-AMP cyclohydrolase
MNPNFQKSELLPAIIQDFETKEILMLGYMNKEAFEKTLKEKRVTFFSRTKNRLWTKGESSGNFLDLISFQIDCDEDTILIQVKPNGPTCHTGNRSCFGETKISVPQTFGTGMTKKSAGMTGKEVKMTFLKELFDLIKERKERMPEGSYTTSLFQEGIYKICTKVSEESGEVIKAATKETKERLAEESADLLYHLMVLLVEKNVDLEEVVGVLEKRNEK